MKNKSIQIENFILQIVYVKVSILYAIIESNTCIE